jgi:hypothetical protein
MKTLRGKPRAKAQATKELHQASTPNPKLPFPLSFHWKPQPSAILRVPIWESLKWPGQGQGKESGNGKRGRVLGLELHSGSFGMGKGNPKQCFHQANPRLGKGCFYGSGVGMARMWKRLIVAPLNRLAKRAIYTRGNITGKP